MRAAAKNVLQPSKFQRDLPKNIGGLQKRNGLMQTSIKPTFKRLNSIGVKKSTVRGLVKLDSSNSSVKSDLDSSEKPDLESNREVSGSNLVLDEDQLMMIPEIESVHYWDEANLIANSRIVESERIIPNSTSVTIEFEGKKSQSPPVEIMTVPTNGLPPRLFMSGIGFSILKKIGQTTAKDQTASTVLGGISRRAMHRTPPKNIVKPTIDQTPNPANKYNSFGHALKSYNNRKSANQSTNQYSSIKTPKVKENSIVRFFRKRILLIFRDQILALNLPTIAFFQKSPNFPCKFAKFF